MAAHAALQRAGCLAVALVSFPCAAATVSGVVEIPASDGGYQFELSSSNPCKVRVEGTSISADVIPSSRTTGTFALARVPQGLVTLVFVEPDGSVGGTAAYDAFTMKSKRLRIEVAGDVADATFALEYHWKRLPSYPPPRAAQGPGGGTLHWRGALAGASAARLRLVSSRERRGRSRLSSTSARHEPARGGALSQAAPEGRRRGPGPQGRGAAIRPRQVTRAVPCVTVR